MKDEIKVSNAWINTINVEEPSLINCDSVEYMHDRDKNYFDHHLMFYLGKMLVFKVWLPNEPEDKEFKSVKEALKFAGIKITK